MKKKIINCCVFLSFFSPAVTSLPFLWLLSFFIPPRCLLFWLFLATYLTLIYSQTHKIRKHTGKHAERACTAHQGDKASAASAFFIFKVSFCLKTALSCFFQTQLNIDVNSPPPLSSEQLTNKKKNKNKTSHTRCEQTTTHEHLQILCSRSRQFWWQIWIPLHLWALLSHTVGLVTIRVTSHKLIHSSPWCS